MTTSRIANAIKIEEAGFTFIVLSQKGGAYFTASFYMNDAANIMGYYNDLLEDIRFESIEAAKAYCMDAIDNTLDSAYCAKYDL